MDTTTIRFWEGTCGIIIQAKRRNDGDYFWTYRFTRAYKPAESEEWKYAQDFRENHDQAIATLMSRAIQFRQQNDATTWVAAQAAKSNPKVA